MAFSGRNTDWKNIINMMNVTPVTPSTRSGGGGRRLRQATLDQLRHVVRGAGLVGELHGESVLDIPDDHRLDPADLLDVEDHALAHLAAFRRRQGEAACGCIGG